MDAFWSALSAADAAALAACYSPAATFRDPVFDLRDGEVRDMWRMLVAAAPDLRIRVVDRKDVPGGSEGTWEATYTFSATGRPVVNRIRTRIRVEHGRVVGQQDTFPFWRWTRQALGARGTLLGWTPLVRNAVRRQAASRLRKFQAASAAP